MSAEIDVAPFLITVEGMARACATDKEIADFLEISETTLRRKAKPALLKGRARMKTSLRKAQMRTALKGNPAMLIWLGKQILHQVDRQEVMHGEVDMSNFTVAQLEHIARGGSLAKLPRR